MNEQPEQPKHGPGRPRKDGKPPGSVPKIKRVPMTIGGNRVWVDSNDHRMLGAGLDEPYVPTPMPEAALQPENRNARAAYLIALAQIEGQIRLLNAVAEVLRKSGADPLLPETVSKCVAQLEAALAELESH